MNITRKKLIAYFCILSFCFCTLFQEAAQATIQKKIIVNYNGTHSFLTPYAHIVHNKLMLPIKELSQCMQISSVEYYQDSNCYVLNNGLTNLCIYMNNPYTIVGDFGYNTSVAPRTIDGVDYVSADVVAEAFGADLSINESFLLYEVSLKYIEPINSIVFNSLEMSLSIPGVVINNKVMLPITKMADMLKLTCEYYADSDCYILKEKWGNSSVVLYMNNKYTIANEYGYYTSVAPCTINGTAYASADVIAEAIGAYYTQTPTNNSYFFAIDYDFNSKINAEKPVCLFIESLINLQMSNLSQYIYPQNTMSIRYDISNIKVDDYNVQKLVNAIISGWQNNVNYSISKSIPYGENYLVSINFDYVTFSDLKDYIPQDEYTYEEIFNTLLWSGKINYYTSESKILTLFIDELINRFNHDIYYMPLQTMTIDFIVTEINNQWLISASDTDVDALNKLFTY